MSNPWVNEGGSALSPLFIDPSTYQAVVALDRNGEMVILASICPEHFALMLTDVIRDLQKAKLSGGIPYGCSFHDCPNHECGGNHAE